ncbi:MAG: hypothetical protein RL215_749 [Planctomycetota bacterium]
MSAGSEVTADGAGGSFAGIGFAHESAHDGDGFGTFDDECDDGAGGDEGFEVGVEGFADVFGVVESAEFRGHVEHFHADDAEAFVFDASDDASDESALDGVGFSEDESAFEGHVGWVLGSGQCGWSGGGLELGCTGFSLHEMEEFGEQVVAVVRAGSGFRVVLDTEDWQSFMSDTFNGLVVEVDMSDFDIVREAGDIHGEAMILRSNFDAAGAFIEHGLICAAVSEAEFVGSAAEGESQQLESEADAEDRFFADEVADGIDGVGEWFRIAGSVGEEDAVGVECEDFAGGSGTGNDGDAAAEIAEVACDVPFHAVVDGDDVRFAGVIASGAEVGGTSEV